MPRLQSSGPSLTGKKKSSKQKIKRSQNALAIAKHQAPERLKIQQSRLGEPVLDSPQRKRQNEDQDFDLESGNTNAKRRKVVGNTSYEGEFERESDSSGNEWAVGQVDDGNDSEIDSDAAMAESDNEGATIKGSVANAYNRKLPRNTIGSEFGDDEQQEIDLRENVGCVNTLIDESDSFGDEAVDLAAMLDESDDSKSLSQESTSSQVSGDGSDEHENIEALNNEEESMLSYSGDENEDDDAAKLASLRTLVSNMNDEDHKSRRSKLPVYAQEPTAPTQSTTQKLTIADLMSSADSKLRNSLKPLAYHNVKSTSARGGIPAKLDAPLPKRLQDRLNRVAAYEKSKETLNRWIETVKQNRRAEHLSFPLKDPNISAAQGSARLLPVSYSQPLTDLESTIQNIMADSGLTGANGKFEEDRLLAYEELKTNTIPLQQVQARRAELRRARGLLFREEIRAKRIKKIKSKTYRKVHRKERERNAQQEKDALIAAGVDASESEQERKDRRRAEERMGGRHRESRWAKGIKESGRAKWDEDARGGVTEMARREEELRRRIEGNAVSEDNDGIASSDSEDDGDADDIIKGSDNLSNERLQRLHKDADELESHAQGSKLASMDFMKKADHALQAQNKEDLKKLRRNLAGEESPSEEEAEGLGRKMFGPAIGKKFISTEAPPESRGGFDERQDSQLDDRDGFEKLGDREPEVIVDVPSHDNTDSAVAEQSFGDRRKEALRSSQEPVGEMDINPWLMPSKKGHNYGKGRAEDKHSKPIISNTQTADEKPSTKPKTTPEPLLKRTNKTGTSRKSVQFAATNASEEASDAEDSNETAEKAPFVLRNRDLVSKAFAGDEVVADFEAEKRATIEDEEEKIIDVTLPGWGSWTGEGIGKKQLKRNKGKIFTKQPGVAKEKRQDAKLDRVIINEKRAKKNGKYLASSLPHPFETMQQYQRSLRMPVGPEFSTKLSFLDATKPRILMKQGIIAPMAKPMI